VNLDEAHHRIFPNRGSKNGGKFFIQTNPLEHVHIVDMSVSKLLMAEQLILVHLLNGADGDVVAVRGHMNIIVCKIMAQPWGPVWQWHEG
jgi:hypothetical protein